MRLYTSLRMFVQSRDQAMSDDKVRFQECNCLAIRQAARHVTQFYDQLFAPMGLRATQYAILSRLRQHGPMSINALANLLVMDRTTLGRNILPLQRDGLIEVAASAKDRRRHELRLTEAGVKRHREGLKHWEEAQQRFNTVFGDERAAALRDLLHEVSASDFAEAP
jgi:DNA-binding MarR family transcriptional regulator